MVGDPIADLVVRISNASRAGKETTSVPFSTIKENIAKVLVREGYIEGFSVRGGDGAKKMIDVKIKYAPSGTPHIRDISRVSKSSRRIYASYKEMKPFKFGRGRILLSTPKGVMTDTEAKKERVGGEVLLTVW
jgi:small subunit ribosomal protein S8